MLPHVQEWLDVQPVLLQLYAHNVILALLWLLEIVLIVLNKIIVKVVQELMSVEHVIQAIH